MAKRIRKLEDAALVAVLDEALARGAMSLPDACRALRARMGLTQAGFAKRAAVALKVVKQLEAGRGNPTLESLRRIFALAGTGLEIAVARRSRAEVRLGAVRGRVRREDASRRAELRALARGGAHALREQHRRAGLSGSDFDIELGSLK